MISQRDASLDDARAKAADALLKRDKFRTEATDLRTQLRAEQQKLIVSQKESEEAANKLHQSLRNLESELKKSQSASAKAKGLILFIIES